MTKHRIRTKLTPAQAARLARISQKYNQTLVIPEYPCRLGAGNHIPAVTPQQVLIGVQKLLRKLPLANASSNELFIGEFNAEFGNESKALYFKSSYLEIIRRCHLLFWEEVSPRFLKVLGKAAGYGHFGSPTNSRGQGVGFLVHPRLRLLTPPVLYKQLVHVENIPDLRPALRLNLQDTVTAYQFSSVVVHLKSMHGGAIATAPIRFQQCHMITRLLDGDTTPILLGGDWNAFLKTAAELQPLLKAGFQLVKPSGQPITQQDGGFIDGYFVRSFEKAGEIGAFRAYNFWSDPDIGPSFSDHSLTQVKMIMLDGNHLRSG